MRTFYVYILTNNSRTLYAGVTNDLERRVFEHKTKYVPGFTATYNIDRLIYFEEHAEPTDAIAREKQIIGWLRQKKIDLIEQINPTWRDLAADWFTPAEIKLARSQAPPRRIGRSFAALRMTRGSARGNQTWSHDRASPAPRHPEPSEGPPCPEREAGPQTKSTLTTPSPR